MTDTKLHFTNRLFAVRFFVLSTIQTLVSLVFGGERCLRCSAHTLRIPLCKRCLPILWRTGVSRACIRCGRALISEIGLCTYCRQTSALQNVGQVSALHDYQLWKKSLLFAWKMENKRNLSVYFAAILYQKLRVLEQKLDRKLFVVPVPPRPGKIAERGWDQIDELCFYLAHGWNVKILRVLERLSHAQQKKLDRAQRIEGIASSYRLKKQRRLARIAKNVPDAVVLVDDVLTTGSTIEACSRELKKWGVRRIFPITLFIVD